MREHPAGNRAARTDSGRAEFGIDRMAVAIFLVALAARLLHIWFLRESPLFSHLLIDSVSFDARAVDFLAGQWMPREGAFYQAPLYPFFLSMVYRIFGHNLLAARIAQALLGSGTAVFVYLIGRRCCGRATGIVAGFMAALYAMAIHFDFEILRSSLVLFLGALSLHLLLLAAERGGAQRWAAAGLALGLGATARPTILVFIPLAAVWTLFRPGQTRKAAAIAAAVLIAASLVAPATVTAVNYAGVGQFVPISMNGGLNFYLGNNSDYERTVGMRPGTQWSLLNREPGVDPTVDPAGWSRYYYGRAFDYIRSEPLGWVSLLFKKSVLFWNGHEIERNSSFSYIAERSLFLAIPLVSYRWMAPLALVGLLLAWRNRAHLGLIALFFGAQMAATVAFYVCTRHRLPAAPALYIFSAYGLVALTAEIRKNGRRAAPWLLAVVLVF
ncbi:MAG: glycosyltransferase family 39 protein, partial [Armatimonadetes bacterium]|nr:glycosyltransferase family 39 protein [Armatimonadota bacterium]